MQTDPGWHQSGPQEDRGYNTDGPTQNVASLQSFNGMVNYLKRFSQSYLNSQNHSGDYASLGSSGHGNLNSRMHLKPLNKSSQHSQPQPTLIRLRNIQCNASKKGLGAVLLQESKPVMYVSRALTETEQRYSNIERELLAIVFALERLNHYIFGRTITVQSDHQPLQNIWKKSIVSASPRLQRLLLRGKENVIADALSRVCPLQSNNSKIKDSNIDVIPVHHITQTAPVSKARLQELRLATQSDPTLSKKDCPEQLLDFWSFKQEFSEEDGLLYDMISITVLTVLSHTLLSLMLIGQPYVYRYTLL